MQLSLLVFSALWRGQQSSPQQLKGLFLLTLKFSFSQAAVMECTLVQVGTLWRHSLDATYYSIEPTCASFFSAMVRVHSRQSENMTSLMFSCGHRCWETTGWLRFINSSTPANLPEFTSWYSPICLPFPGDKLEKELKFQCSCCKMELQQNDRCSKFYIFKNEDVNSEVDFLIHLNYNWLSL